MFTNPTRSKPGRTVGRRTPASPSERSRQPRPKTAAPAPAAPPPAPVAPPKPTPKPVTPVETKRPTPTFNLKLWQRYSTKAQEGILNQFAHDTLRELATTHGIDPAGSKEAIIKRFTRTFGKHAEPTPKPPKIVPPPPTPSMSGKGANIITPLSKKLQAATSHPAWVNTMRAAPLAQQAQHLSAYDGDGLRQVAASLGIPLRGSQAELGARILQHLNPAS